MTTCYNGIVAKIKNPKLFLISLVGVVVSWWMISAVKFDFASDIVEMNQVWLIVASFFTGVFSFVGIIESFTE